MRIAAIVAVLVMATLAAAQYNGSASADSVFTPTTTVRLCNALPATFVDAELAGTGPTCAETLTPGSNAALTFTTDIPAGNVNFSDIVTFAPTGPLNVQVGTKVGGVRMLGTYGLSNNSCSSALTVDFVLFDVALPDASTRAAMTNIAWPQAPGVTDRFGDWKVGDGVHTSNPPLPSDSDWATEGDEDVVLNGDHADSSTLSITNYPIHLLDAFDPDFVPGVGDGASEPLIPTAAYGALTVVSGEVIPLYFASFPAGALTALPTPFGAMNATMGFPIVTVMEDPTSTIVSPSTITDFCTGVNATVMLRSNIRTNPAAGTRYYLQYISSQRDTDQDGFENAIDTCPFSGVSGIENPRATIGPGDSDSDDDGIKDSCDANTGDSDSDDDNDGIMNRLDNCPEFANAENTESEAGVTAPDFGPRTDQIGDACDSGTLTVTQNGASVTVGVGGVLSSSVANGRYHTVTNLIPKCFEATDTDNDNDGYCDANDNADSGNCVQTTPRSCFIRHTSWLLGSCLAHPGCQMDSDGDTVTPVTGVIRIWSDVVETYLGTDTTKPCSQTSTANDESPLDNWGFDLDDNRTVNGADWLKLASVVNNGGSRAINLSPATGLVTPGTETTPAYLTVPGMGVQSQQRFDLNLDGQLALGSDLGGFSAYMFRPCGTAGAPPQTVNNSGTFQQ